MSFHLPKLIQALLYDVFIHVTYVVNFNMESEILASGGYYAGKGEYNQVYPLTDQACHLARHVHALNAIQNLLFHLQGMLEVLRCMLVLFLLELQNHPLLTSFVLAFDSDDKLL